MKTEREEIKERADRMTAEVEAGSDEEKASPFFVIVSGTAGDRRLRSMARLQDAECLGRDLLEKTLAHDRSAHLGPTYCTVVDSLADLYTVLYAPDLD